MAKNVRRMTSKFRATKREPSPLVGPAVSDSDTLPTLPPLKLRVTALFSFSFAPHRFRRLILLRTTNEHASSDKLDVVRSRLKRDKREQGVSGGGSVVRLGRTVEKNEKKEKKKKKKKKTQKKKKNRAHRDHLSRRPPRLHNLRTGRRSREADGREGRGGREKGTEKLVHRDEMNEEETADTWSALRSR